MTRNRLTLSLSLSHRSYNTDASFRYPLRITEKSRCLLYRSTIFLLLEISEVGKYGRFRSRSTHGMSIRNRKTCLPAFSYPRLIWPELVRIHHGIDVNFPPSDGRRYAKENRDRRKRRRRRRKERRRERKKGERNWDNSRRRRLGVDN